MRKLAAVCAVFFLTACGGSPTANLSVTKITFGNEPASTTSPAQGIKLSNTGSATLSITKITTTGDFSQTNTCNSSVAAGASCKINVSFTPPSVDDFSGTLSIVDNASGSPQTVSLTGTGVAACIPIRSRGYGPAGRGQCCPAPRPLHSYCSNATGWGTCVED